MKKHRKTIAIFSVVVLLAVSCLIFFKKKEKSVLIETTRPVLGSLTKVVTATGTLQPIDTVAVGVQVSGTIKNIYVDFNSVVKKGQLLAELDPELLQSQEQQVAANLQQARANLDYQSSNYKRQQQLYNAGVISKADLETATYQFRAAQENVNSIQSQLRAAEKDLSFTHIYSPIEGTVLSRNVSAGQTVAANFNTPTLFSIANDLRLMQVRASVDEADIGNVQNKQKVSFTVDAYPDETFYGTVIEIRLEPLVTANVVTYTTIIEANNSNLMLKPGMTANINIITQEQDNILLIPQKATQFVPNESLLKQYIIKPLPAEGHQYNHDINNNHASGNTKAAATVNMANLWVEKGDTLIEKQIQTGLSNDIQESVIKGLSTTDIIVTGINMRNASSKMSTQERSPFMPTAKGGNNNGNRNNGR